MEENLADTLQQSWTTMGVAATTGLRILLIALAAWIAIAVLQRTIRGFRTRLAARMADREQIKRAETLGRVARYLVAVIVSLIAVMLILAELGISVAPILGAAQAAVDPPRQALDAVPEVPIFGHVLA